jgi:hypothetical protein
VEGLQSDCGARMSELAGLLERRGLIVVGVRVKTKMDVWRISLWISTLLYNVGNGELVKERGGGKRPFNGAKGGTSSGFILSQNRIM